MDGCLPLFVLWGWSVPSSMLEGWQLDEHVCSNGTLFNSQITRICTWLKLSECRTKGDTLADYFVTETLRGKRVESEYPPEFKRAYLFCGGNWLSLVYMAFSNIPATSQQGALEMGVIYCTHVGIPTWVFGVPDWENHNDKFNICYIWPLSKWHCLLTELPVLQTMYPCFTSFNQRKPNLIASSSQSHGYLNTKIYHLSVWS